MIFYACVAQPNIVYLIGDVDRIDRYKLFVYQNIEIDIK